MVCPCSVVVGVQAGLANASPEADPVHRPDTPGFAGDNSPMSIAFAIA
jgi:hypothetical protein